ncbi:MAG: glycosyltransferase family 2 protein [Candidatus Nanopelagicales bacterium]
MTATRPSIALVIPCHNEEATVGLVIAGMREWLPSCSIYVADNNSSDRTAEMARAAGAEVITESRAGKGFAVRRLLADVDADCYVMVDGDNTYEPSAAPAMVDLVLCQQMDMVNGARVIGSESGRAYRRGHALGNAILTWIFQRLFSLPLVDTLSGYRVMSRRFVKSFPAGSTGFEIEAELNAHAATLGVPVGEVPTEYRERPEGSHSKLSTYRDGWRILKLNLRLFRDARPNRAFVLLAVPWLLLAGILILIPVSEYLRTEWVSRVPTLIAGVGCLVVAALLIVAGMILERIARNRVEALRLQYLMIPPYRGSTPLTSRQTGLEKSHKLCGPKPARKGSLESR